MEEKEKARAITGRESLLTETKDQKLRRQAQEDCDLEQKVNSRLVAGSRSDWWKTNEVADRVQPKPMADKE